MKLEQIRKKVKENTVKPLGVDKIYSVLIPLLYRDDQLSLLYEVRAEKLSTQPGEISFPGGGLEEGESPLVAALRETSEELNIKQSQIDLIGELDYIVTPYNIIIYVYTAILREISFNQIRPNPDEVDELFTVPVQYLLENKPDIYQMKVKRISEEDFPFHLIRNGTDYNWREGRYPVYFYRYRDRVIWGFTARMTENFCEIISS